VTGEYEHSAACSRWQVACALWAVAFASACGGAGAFVCEADDQCSRGSESGTCEAGLCAFPDPECESGKRYGGLSGDRAGECVPPSDGGTETIGTGEDVVIAGSSSGEAGSDADTLAVSADASAGDTSVPSSTGEATTQGDTGPETGSSTSDSGGPEDAVHNYVFVTSGTRAVSAFGGLAGADAWCGDLASRAGLPGQYVAWLSTPTVNAIDRLGDAQGWARVDGRPFARSAAAIASSEHLYPIRLDEQGDDLLGANVVTATGGDGTYVGVTDCGGWTSAVGDARRAPSDALGESFTTVYDATCDVSIRIYCFGIDDAIDVAIDLPPPGRRAFATATSVPASSGLAAFDAQCQEDAEAAGVPGTFSALVSTTTTPASARFDLGGEPWSLLNDVPVVLNAADLAVVDGTLIAPIWLSATGVDQGGGSVWQGSVQPALEALPDTSCGDWSVTTGEALVGSRARSAQWWATTTQLCTESRRVLCLEE
jgi:hypothetical protein